MNKYEMLQDDKIKIGGRILYRIKALKDFKDDELYQDVKAGDLGGYVEKEKNLSQEGNCWVYGNARVYGDARVFGSAYVFDNASVCGNACVRDNACVYGDAYVFDNAYVYGNAYVYDNARVCDNACVCGNACVRDNARVYDNARVCDNACVCGNACVRDNARVCDNACVRDNAKINKISDVLCISPIGSRNDTTTFFKTKDGNICVKCGCFSGTIDRFLEAVSETHKDNKHAKAYRLACELAKIRIELEDV